MISTETTFLAQATAFNIAATAARPGLEHLVAREAGDLAARFLDGKPHYRFWLEMAKRPAFHRWFERYQSLTIPGMALHQALRKLSLEEAAIHGLEAGMDQIVILSGGFDTLGARLARRYPHARLLDFTPHSLIASKRRVLKGAGFLPSNLTLLPLDLKRMEKGGGISLPGFDPASPSVFLCESLLMRLDRAAVERLFADLAALPCPALRLAFTFMEPDARGNFSFRKAPHRLLSRLLGRGRAFSWGLPARDLGAFLARRGFALEEIADAGVFRARFLAGSPRPDLAEGEKVAIASLLARRP